MQHFMTRLGQWPKINFSEVCITACDENGSVPPEIYVRDRADPPCWLFIRRLRASENRETVMASYRLWLTEYHRQRGTDYCLLPPSAPEQPEESSPEWQSLPQPPQNRSLTIGR